MKSILNCLEKLELEFTDTQLTGSAGLTFLSSVARRYGLLDALNDFEPCKVRDRGASDQANVWSLIACLASGRGTLRDLEDLRQDQAACRTLGLEVVSGSRRTGEWLRRMTPSHVASLRSMATAFARRLVSRDTETGGPNDRNLTYRLRGKSPEGYALRAFSQRLAHA